MNVSGSAKVPSPLSPAEYNYFEDTGLGDSEAISVKSRQNVLRWNTMNQNPWALMVFRNGDDHVVYGNFFSDSGGIRVKEAHNIFCYNNYLERAGIGGNKNAVTYDFVSPNLRNVNFSHNTFVESGLIALGNGATENTWANQPAPVARRRRPGLLAKRGAGTERRRFRGKRHCPGTRHCPGVDRVSLRPRTSGSPQNGTATVNLAAPGIFTVRGDSPAPAAFYLRVTAANQRISDYVFDLLTLAAIDIPRATRRPDLPTALRHGRPSFAARHCYGERPSAARARDCAARAVRGPRSDQRWPLTAEPAQWPRPDPPRTDPGGGRSAMICPYREPSTGTIDQDIIDRTPSAA